MKTRNNYNTNQMTLEISLQFGPKPNHPASLINDFIDTKNYILGTTGLFFSWIIKIDLICLLSRCLFMS